MLLEEPQRAADSLDALRKLGVRLSLDDFGTGYSSFVHLRHIPVSEIKIDRSFVARLTVDEEDAAIVRSTVDLAHSLGLRVIAEGVEDDATWDRLRDMGCDSAQGLADRPRAAPRRSHRLAGPARRRRPHGPAPPHRRQAVRGSGRCPRSGRPRRPAEAPRGRPRAARPGPGPPLTLRCTPICHGVDPARELGWPRPNHPQPPLKESAACLASRARRSPTSPGCRGWSCRPRS
ncbi:EAL domain-containing protein [Yinghuangia aomiensis]